MDKSAELANCIENYLNTHLGGFIVNCSKSSDDLYYVLIVRNGKVLTRYYNELPLRTAVYNYFTYFCDEIITQFKRLILCEPAGV